MATYRKLLEARDTMDALAARKLPPRLSLKLARSLRLLFGGLTELEDVRKRLLQEYAKKNRHGDVMFEKDGQPKWDDKESFTRELNEALDTESDIKFAPLKLKFFPKSVEFTPMEALSLAEAGIVDSDPEA